ncbi:hypothetical protein EFK50_01145 [Nocardioides marmoriginsengisoli]|uniref:Uncharacterized protein n=1 Tax=Nocardioides marmoriginsengisoli TaxID=661483 RepID=A0A3N0CRZ8_9ACTN|nr:hypothetical protein [Nocardioides marmoriginsengisoli]RNL66262.1 hypothetical protein EFK50_01145 [Nocardioides marmoriginsengisoli]
MSRRTHPCLACWDETVTNTPFTKSRRTRHKDRICALCRRRGVHMRDGHLIVPITINYRGRAA